MIRLLKVTERRKKRVGRGMGSGKGSHTAGRGQKGQKSMGDIGILFEGYKTKKSYLKRLPLQRGKGKFHAKVGRRAKMETFRLKNKDKSKASEKAVKSSK